MKGAAALMASAYAKLTGKVGVCLTIAGPNRESGVSDRKGRASYDNRWLGCKGSARQLD
jgi:hypothetical protein